MADPGLPRPGGTRAPAPAPASNAELATLETAISPTLALPPTRSEAHPPPASAVPTALEPVPTLASPPGNPSRPLERRMVQATSDPLALEARSPSRQSRHSVHGDPATTPTAATIAQAPASLPPPTSPPPPVRRNSSFHPGAPPAASPAPRPSPSKKLKDYVDDFLEGSGADLPDPSALHPNPRTVRILAHRRHFRKALEVSEGLLSGVSTESAGVPLTPLDRGELRYCRAQCYVRVGMLERAVQELQQIMSVDAGEVDPNPATDHRQAFLQLHIALLALELRIVMHPASAALAVHRLSDVMDALRDPTQPTRSSSGAALDLRLPLPLPFAEIAGQMSAQDREVWARRFATAVASGQARQLQWRAVIRTLETQLSGLQETGSSDPKGAASRTYARAALLSRICHVFVQVGAAGGAQQALASLEAELHAKEGDEPSSEVEPLVSLTRGAVAFGEGEFGAALGHYRAALDRERKLEAQDWSVDGLSPSLRQKPASEADFGETASPPLPQELGWRAAEIQPGAEGVGFDRDLVITAANNLAIAALYTCQLRTAVDILEKLVGEDPHRFLTKGVAFNLCTLYDLSCEPSVAGRKKRVLQQIAIRFHLEDLNAGSFRIPG